MKMNLRTDLAIEEFAKEQATSQEERNYFGCKVTYLDISEEEAKKYKKNGGQYYTLETTAFKELDHDKEQKVIKAIQKIMKELLDSLNIGFDDRIFVVGLGNSEITPDALGPLVVSKLLVTRHLFENNIMEDNMRIVSALAPGVMGQTGIETSDIIQAVVKKEKPSLVVVIDALAARSIRRINQSIQFTTSGINPGSGIGNKRKELSKKTLGTNVIAIGVPTVVDVLNITHDVFGHLDNLIEDENTKQEINNLRGQLFERIDEDEGLDFFVTPKEIDQNIVDMANVISRALNISFHNI